MLETETNKWSKADLAYVNEQIKDMMVILKNGWYFVFNVAPNLNQSHYRMIQQASLVIDNEGRMIKCRWMMTIRKGLRFRYNHRKIELVEEK